MTVIVPSTLAQYGIAQMRFGGLSADDIRAYRDDILHGIKEVIEHGQLMADKALYSPQNRPIEYYLGEGERWDFGLMLDVFACTDELIEQSADSIIEKLRCDAVHAQRGGA